MSAVSCKVALIQMACADDAQVNLTRASDRVREAAKLGANIVCLPELFMDRYFPAEPCVKSSFELAKPIPGPETEALSKLAKECGVYLVGGSIFERDGDKFYNTAVVFDDSGKLIKSYRKCHIPQDPGFYEKDYFAAGDKLEVIDTKYGKICVMICFDQWFPEAARAAAVAGAQLIIYPTAIGMPDNIENITGDWREMWQIAQRGHAAVNNVYVAAINRVGNEQASDGSSTTFFGGSFICDFAGHKIADAGDGEKIISAECNFKRQKEVQEAWCFFPNRRPSIAVANA